MIQVGISISPLDAISLIGHPNNDEGLTTG